MRKVAIPGSFDPLTIGHMDIIEEAIKVFDHVYLIVAQNTAKKRWLDPELSINILEENYKKYPNISCIYHNGLVVNLLAELEVKYIVRGLRTASEFDYEKLVARVNSKLSDIKTIFFLSEHDYISSTLIREIVTLGGSCEKFVSSTTYGILKNNII
jgi:pantetheine-phosphate adenylyltransferase